jgi:hypothetical protein
MIKVSSVVLALTAVVGTAGTALGQPGNTPPTAPPPDSGAPPQAAPPPGITGMQVGPVDVDQVISTVAANEPAIERIATNAFRRARRAISVGPTVGFFGGAVPAQSTYDDAVTFGIGLEMFKIPIWPEPEAIQELIVDRLKAELKGQLLARLAGGRAPSREEVEQLAHDLYQKVRAEVLRVDATRPRTMEDPAFSLGLEGNYLIHSGQWMPRLRAGIGIWKFTLGGSFGVGFGDRVGVYTGVEIVTHFLLSDEPRASVVDLFVRADFEDRFRDTNTDQIVFGTRFLLDAI